MEYLNNPFDKLNIEAAIDIDLDILSRQEIKKNLWNDVIFTEFDSILMGLKPDFTNGKKMSAVDTINDLHKKQNEAAIIWNKKFSHFRFYNNNIYFIELINDAISMPDVHFIRYNINSFLSIIWSFLNEYVKFKKFLSNILLYLIAFIFICMFLIFLWLY